MAKKRKTQSGTVVPKQNRELEGTLVFRQAGAVLENTAIEYRGNELYIRQGKSFCSLSLIVKDFAISKGILHFSGHNSSTGYAEDWDFYVKGQKAKFTGAK